MAFNSSSTNNSLIQKLITVVVLAAAFLVSAGTVVYYSLRGKEITVPNLVGKSEGEADRLLAEQGLRLKVRTHATDEKIQANLVSEQIPNAGFTVKAGQVIGVNISTGIEAREVAKETKKTVVAAKPKPSEAPKKKPKPKEGDKDNKDKSEKDTAKKGIGSDDKSKPAPALKTSPKPSPKPSPKKAEEN